LGRALPGDQFTAKGLEAGEIEIVDAISEDVAVGTSLTRQLAGSGNSRSMKSRASSGPRPTCTAIRNATPFGWGRKVRGSLIAARNCAGSEVSKSTRASFTIEVTGMWLQPAIAVISRTRRRQCIRNFGFMGIDHIDDDKLS
jgi:hypothetical protein